MPKNDLTYLSHIFDCICDIETFCKDYTEESFISDKVDILTSLIDNETDIDVLRPALGIPPKFKNIVIGKELKIDIEKGQPLFWENF